MNRTVTERNTFILITLYFSFCAMNISTVLYYHNYKIYTTTSNTEKDL